MVWFRRGRGQVYSVIFQNVIRKGNNWIWLGGGAGGQPVQGESGGGGEGGNEGAAGQTVCTKECKISRKWFEIVDDKIPDRKATINGVRM